MTSHIERQQKDQRLNLLDGVIGCAQRLRSVVEKRASTLKWFTANCELVELAAGNIGRIIEYGIILPGQPVRCPPAHDRFGMIVHGTSGNLPALMTILHTFNLQETSDWLKWASEFGEKVYRYGLPEIENDESSEWCRLQGDRLWLHAYKVMHALKDATNIVILPQTEDRLP